jgi:hypothetical protein
MAIMPSQQWLNGKLILEVGNQVKNAGFYNLTNNDSIIASVAFNYSREESIMEFLTSDELKDWIGKQSNIELMEVQNKTIKTNMVREEKPLWKFFILIAIVFLIFEILIIKVMKS